MKNYMQAYYYPAFISGSPADHTYVKLFEDSNIIDVYSCFGESTNGDNGCSSTFSDLESKKIKKVFENKKVRGTKDSATINYGVNGVCHQAANRFLHPSYITMVQNIDYRPKGLNTSCYTYGEYGNIFWQYEDWRNKYYFPECEKNNLVINTENCVKETPEGYLWYKCENKYGKKTKSENYIDDIVYETEAMLSVHIPTLVGNPIGEVQRAILQEREKFMETIGIHYSEELKELQLPVFMKEIVKQLIEKTNDLSKQIQSELKSKIGEKDFILINGTKEYLDIADLNLAYTLLLD